MATGTVGAARHDLLILLANRLFRAFGFGASAVVITFHLEGRGLNAVAIGLVLSASLAAASITGLVAAAASVRWNRRRVLSATGLLMSIAGLDMALAPAGWLYVVAAATGMLGAGALDLGPYLSVEQAMLSETATPRQRNRAFGRYMLTGALAFSAGAAIAGFVTTPHASERFFLVYACLGVVTAALPLLLSSRVETGATAPAFGNIKPLLVLAGLFSIDALGSGFVVQSVLVYWFHVRFGATPEILGPAFSAMSLIGALSFELSGRLADRFGLINTMVFTHLPSSILLIVLAVSPNLPVAIAVLLLRATLTNMDAPARQAYVVSIVKPSERAGAVAVTGAVRGVALAFGPVITGIAIQTAFLAAPILVSGGLKTAYDAMLYAGFRKKPAEHELGSPRAEQLPL